MKTINSTVKFFSKLINRKKLVVISGAIFGLALASVSSYAYYHHQNAIKATNSSTPASTKEKLAADQTKQPVLLDTQSSNPTAPPAVTQAPQQKNVTPQPATQQSVADRRASLRPQPAPPVFTAGRLTSGVVCYTDFYAYSLGTVSVSANTISPGMFSWRIELSNGEVYRQSSDSIPYGRSVAPDFPSTPGFPGSFGYIMYPPDGLKARFVITSPNYSTGAWSDPVPIGSSASCHSSPDYIQPEIQYED